MEFYEVIGTFGVTCFLVAYFQLQQGNWHAHSLKYLFVNLCGATLVMISLVFDWNLPAFMLEAIWALISIYGIVKVLKNRIAD